VNVVRPTEEKASRCGYAGRSDCGGSEVVRAIARCRIVAQAAVKSGLLLFRPAASKRQNPGSAEKSDRELAQQRLDALEVMIGGPQHGIAGMGRNGDLEVGQGQNLAAVAQFGAEQSNALPRGAVKFGPWQTGERRDQISAVLQARASDELGEDWAAGENLVSIEGCGQFGGDLLRACA
jgi:hypothetical protein